MSSLKIRRRKALRAEGRPALIIVDVQRSFGDPEYLTRWGLSEAVSGAIAGAVTSCAALLENAREHGISVYWVELASDPSRPWRASNWLRFGDPEALMALDEPCVAGTPGADWYSLAPGEGEYRVRKRGYSGFHNTDLEHRLREDGIGWVSVVGLTTECCIAATATDAFQRDWPVLVPSDATSAYDLDAHENALNQLSLTSSDICTSDELISLWRTTGEMQ